jgi:predicted alpha/beta-fold hydrolase
MALIAHPFTPGVLLGNQHAQTIFPALFRGGGPRAAMVAECWPMPDGEALDVELLPDRPGQPGVLVLHGLEGSARARYVRGLLAAVEARGWNGAALSFRSCGPTPLTGRRLYHSGDTRDLPAVIARLQARWRGPLGAVGFSMGGNILLKWLGEAGQGAQLAATVAISVPYDLAACAVALDGPGLFAAVYRERFLRTLRRKALAVAARFPGLLDAAAVRSCRSFARYDDLVTAPLFGFASAADYWARSSSAPLLPAIRRPARLISAEDDPFVPAPSIPRTAIAANPALDGLLLARGGHVGFVSGGWRRSYAVDALAIEFLAAHFPGDVSEGAPSR